jgi:2-polyprenyl-3-methyl-5-hydroxy-6-metoxy-1,4-benzoquinol methylase
VQGTSEGGWRSDEAAPTPRPEFESRSLTLNFAISEPQSYDCVAEEYYDSERHPTCDNFGELSERFIVPRLCHDAESRKQMILEVGAGRSIVARFMAEAGRSLNQLVLLDCSSAMLLYSQQWERQGAKLLVADARSTKLATASFHIIVASLGDPYNCPSFWREVARLLQPDGICLFTSPTFDWASRFRNRESFEHAEFLLRGGNVVKVSSIVPPLEQQLEMISRAGLTVREVVAFCRADLRHRPSPKLDVFNGKTDLPVVRGFTIQKISSTSTN